MSDTERPPVTQCQMKEKDYKNMLQSLCQAIQTVWSRMTQTNSLSFRLIGAGVGSAARCSGLVLCLVLLFACLFFCLSDCLTGVTQGEDFKLYSHLSMFE